MRPYGPNLPSFDTVVQYPEQRLFAGLRKHKDAKMGDLTLIRDGLLLLVLYGLIRYNQGILYLAANCPLLECSFMESSGFEVHF